jgi:hypothetical protein
MANIHTLGDCRKSTKTKNKWTMCTGSNLGNNRSKTIKKSTKKGGGKKNVDVYTLAGLTSSRNDVKNSKAQEQVCFVTRHETWNELVLNSAF